MTFEWIRKHTVLALHQAGLSLFGGLPGVRDEGALDSALARPVNKHAYGEEDIANLAAAYAFGFAKNHPFNDGNKRIALAVAYTFLADNGYELEAEKLALTASVFRLAGSEVSEEDFAQFLRENVVAR